ncbi:hypothetical protein E2C01_062724 [Portunus trituberculatus]|uniref:Uncharacterized protein n=1 Tax=Portunus trituberculatus TaxID=210409 RepID=A0A5B7HBV6_PORTR|nr:hypothetical protein [Portunus trituberculatus]
MKCQWQVLSFTITKEHKGWTNGVIAAGVDFIKIDINLYNIFPTPIRAPTSLPRAQSPALSPFRASVSVGDHHRSHLPPSLPFSSCLPTRVPQLHHSPIPSASSSGVNNVTPQGLSINTDPTGISTPTCRRQSPSSLPHLQRPCRESTLHLQGKNEHRLGKLPLACRKKDMCHSHVTFESVRKNM